MTQFVHLFDPALGMAAQRDLPPRGGKNPTSSWLPGEVIVDEISLQIGAEVAPGDYQLRLGLYDAANGATRVPVRDKNDNDLPDSQILLTTITVGR
ncbi:MAG: hypothetical protein HC802_13530 [Caldilineaceae bacterium]|nr:hypothetical protein [Caldilineaceae bacterium]